MKLSEDAIAIQAWKNAHVKFKAEVDNYILEKFDAPTPEMIRIWMYNAAKHVLEAVLFQRIDPFKHVEINTNYNPDNQIEILLEVRAKTNIGAIFTAVYESVEIDPRG